MPPPNPADPAARSRQRRASTASGSRTTQAWGGRQLRPQHYAPPMTPMTSDVADFEDESTPIARTRRADFRGHRLRPERPRQRGQRLPTLSPGRFTQVFSGTLLPGGSQSYAFSLSASVPLRVSLSSLTDLTESPISTSLRLTSDGRRGTGCGALQTVTVPGLPCDTSHLPAIGRHLLRRRRGRGAAQASAIFGVRITQGELTSFAKPETETYSSVLFPGGFTSRTFEASAAES